MSITALDSRVFRNLFGTQEIRDVFSDEAYVRCLIETESAPGTSRGQNRGDSCGDGRLDHNISLKRHNRVRYCNLNLQDVGLIDP